MNFLNVNIQTVQEDNVRNYMLLVSLNPELQTIPMVESEVVAGGDCRRWSGVIGRARVREYTFMQMYADGEQYVFRDNTEPMKTYLSDNGYSEQEIAEEVENIEWQKAIFLDIDIG
ncbi:MAG TPA: hypothetical protein H9742_01920 [Candidatus Acetatifactor stercoripullorum]|uniref:Uncharacterized protein n=1 Tax=Candidatus Acetatifactor stercoripullorum TaxID=2838414 RepID=A0A9D1R3F2_9FIRM|nr:hypothetical protein [uncultured Acetatifactor sp.]HIW80275.1 hypothetical protein [Candidatus Acetatifactor stercoripullorum]